MNKTLATAVLATCVPTWQRSRTGLGWVPQERHMSPSLTVEEHLLVVARPGPWNLRKVYEVFPRLLERRQNMGNQLSGGEPVIVVEQHARLALSLTERAIVLDRGRIVHDSDSASLPADGDKLDRLVSVA